MPSLHSGQQQVADSTARFKVLASGRRWGKTRLGSALCVRQALLGGRAWWVAPSYKMAAVGWRGIRQLAAQIPGVELRQVDRMAEFTTGGWAQIRSADDPDSLRGEGLDLVVLDECAFMKEAAWGEALRPALSDRQGRALFISTPKGHNWFWRLWMRGNGGEDNWAAWQFPTSTNPFIAQGEIDEAQANLPDRIFRQEYLAEFIEDAGGVFRGVLGALGAEPLQHGLRGQKYVFGVDWGKYQDFTVICVLDAAQREMVAMDRFNQIDYAFQRQRLQTWCDRFGPEIIVAERNAMGEPVIEELQRSGLPVRPFTTTNASKTEAIEALALAIERNQIKLLNDRVLVGELQGYEAQRLPSGMLRYGAPEGMHDDCVIALALAWSELAKKKYPPMGTAKYA